MSIFLLNTGFAQPVSDDKAKDNDSTNVSTEAENEDTKDHLVPHTRYRWSIYGGFSGMPGQVSGLNNVYLSDGLSYNGLPTRVSLPLNSYNSSEYPNIGGLVGLEYSINHLISAVASFRFGFSSNSNMSFTALTAGIRIRHELFSGILEIGVSPKVGFTLNTVRFGSVVEDVGYYPVISINNSYLASGDYVQTTAVGFVLEGAADIRWFIGKSGFFIFAEVGWLQSFFGQGSGSITLASSPSSTSYSGASIYNSRSTQIPGNSNYIYNNEDGADKGKNNALNNALFSMTGFIFAVGVGLSF